MSQTLFSHFLFLCYTYNPSFTYDPHTILEKMHHRDELYIYIYIYFFSYYLQTLKMGANDASGEGLQYICMH